MVKFALGRQGYIGPPIRDFVCMLFLSPGRGITPHLAGVLRRLFFCALFNLNKSTG